MKKCESAAIHFWRKYPVDSFADVLQSAYFVALKLGGKNAHEVYCDLFDEYRCAWKKSRQNKTYPFSQEFFNCLSENDSPFYRVHDEGATYCFTPDEYEDYLEDCLAQTPYGYAQVVRDCLTGARQREVGEKYGFSESRVNQIMADFKRKLKRRIQCSTPTSNS